VTLSLGYRVLSSRRFQKAIKLFSKDDIQNKLVYISVNFVFLKDTIKQLETRKITLVQSFGLTEETVENIKQVQGPLGKAVKEKNAVYK